MCGYAPHTGVNFNFRWVWLFNNILSVVGVFNIMVGRGPAVGPAPPDRPKCHFFSSPTNNFVFSSSLEGLLVELWPLQGRIPPKVSVCASLGSYCANSGDPQAAGTRLD